MAFSLNVSQPCGSGNESLLSGQYAMLVKGFDNGKGAGETSPQPVLIGAELYIDGNGNIVAGNLDMNSHSAPGVQESSVSGKYQIGGDQRGCMTLTSNSGTQNYLISVSVVSSGIASTVHMVSSDATGPFTSGVALEQDTTAFSANVINGNYVFEMSSPQGTASPDGGKEAMAGVITLANTDATSGTVTGGSFDLNDKGQLDGSSSTTWSSSTPLSISSTGSSYFIGGGIGNIIFQTTINGNTVIQQNQIYIISANRFLIMSSSDQTQAGALFGAGEAFKQSGTISSGSLNGTSVLQSSALQINSASPVTATSFIGTLTGNVSGNVNINGWQNSGRAIQSRTISGT
ncbi:MAG: hypothetical protein ACRD40_03735, partial [Candidatus Acidiferrales bacterium]